MAEKTQGTVSWAGSKTLKGRTYYSFKMGDDFYRTGLKDSGVAKDDFVEFEYEVNEWGNQVDIASVKKTAQAQGVPAAKAAAKSGGKVKEDWDARAKYWDNKELMDIERQKLISYQAATNTAVNIVTLATEHDMLPVLGGKKQDKFDALCALVTRTADELVMQFMSAPEHVDELMKPEKEAVDTTQGEIDDE